MLHRSCSSISRSSKRYIYHFLPLATALALCHNHTLTKHTEALINLRNFLTTTATTSASEQSTPTSSSNSRKKTEKAIILDGRAVSAAWQDELAQQVQDIRSRGGRPPGLGVILVGNRPDSQLYVTRKQEACERVGIRSVLRRLPANTTQVALRRAVRALCADPMVDGVLVQLPLPRHIDEEDVIEHFDPGKDVDGFHPLNVGRTLMRGRSARFVPCTALGCVELLRRSGIQVRGKSVAIVGDSNIVGMPLAMLFRDEGAANVTVLHRSSYSSLFSAPSGGNSSGGGEEEGEGRGSTTMENKEEEEEEEDDQSSTAVELQEAAEAASREAEQRAQANACLPHSPGPATIYSNTTSTSKIHNRVKPHRREAQPYQVTYSSGMRDAYLPIPHPNPQPHPQPQTYEEDSTLPQHFTELAAITRTADILVVAVGYPHLVKADWVKPGAVVVDVGINAVDWDYVSHGEGAGSVSRPPPQPSSHVVEKEVETEGGGDGATMMTTSSSSSTRRTSPGDDDHPHFHVVGDVDFEEAVHVASAVSPVPGGVGPMTIAALLHNTIHAAAIKMGLRKEYTPSQDDDDDDGEEEKEEGLTATGIRR